MTLTHHDTDAGTDDGAGGALAAGITSRDVIDALLGTLPADTQLAIAWRHVRLGTGSARNASSDEALRAEVLAHLDDPPPVPRARAWIDRRDSGNGHRTVIGVAFDGAPPADWMQTSWFALAHRLIAASLGLANAGARIEALEKSKRLQQALYEISDLAGSGLEMHDMLARIHQVVGGLMPAENFYIVQYDGKHATIRYLYFADSRDRFDPDSETEFAVDQDIHSMTAALLQHGKPLIGAPRKILLAMNIASEEYAGGPLSEDWLGVPLLRGAQVCGAIVVQDYERADRYDTEDRALLEYVAQHILTALDRKTAQVELEWRVKERTLALEQANYELQAEVIDRERAEKLQQALFRITELSMTADSLERFYADLHSIISELLYAKNFYIAFLSDDGKNIEFPYAADEVDTRPHRDRARAKGLTEYVIDTGHALLADRGHIQALESEGLVRSFGPLAHCWLGVPLTRDDIAVGVIGVQSYTPDISFVERDQELLTFVAHHVDAALARKRAQRRLMTANVELEARVETRTRELAETNHELREQIAERLRAEQRLRHQARHDSLTGLPNRGQLQERLDDAIARISSADGNPFAVLFLDIDRFKLINDSVGHVAGDELLVESSRRISQAVAREDLVARLGGDEFAILAENIEGAEPAERCAANILRALGQSMWIEGREIFPSASIGIALWHPRYRKSEELLRDADAAMYRAKRQGRNRSEVFDEEMRAEAVRLLDLEADLRRAIMHDAFEPHFQPILRLQDGEQVGSEALVRWNHEERGLLTPSAFIGVGEDSSLIEQVDWLMYAHVIASMGEYPKHYVSINVSPRHFLSDNFADRLLRMLDEADQDPRRLRIEITEVALIEDAPRALRILRDLRNHGIAALLDDFGTGFSALSYLHRFPIQGLKIDRSFVAGLDSDSSAESLALVRAILAMALTLGIDTIAEGIETEAQRTILIDQGCQFGQGYLMGVPQPLVRTHGGRHRNRPMN
ncbi:MAG: EAL domain-containing protein [Xanthomonadales bacterium]|nr:EAL domain-containing protein [Xanthomonadales bacterium]